MKERWTGSTAYNDRWYYERAFENEQEAREWAQSRLDAGDEKVMVTKSAMTSEIITKPQDYWHVGNGFNRDAGECIHLSIKPDLNDIMGAPMKRLTKEQAMDIADALVAACGRMNK